jgi:hypothetical protein
MIRSSHSRASDTSSAYSGSDVMQSSTNGDDGLIINNDTDDESEDSEEVRFMFFFLTVKIFIYLFSNPYRFVIVSAKH